MGQGEGEEGVEGVGGGKGVGQLISASTTVSEDGFWTIRELLAFMPALPGAWSPKGYVRSYSRDCYGQLWIHCTCLAITNKHPLRVYDGHFRFREREEESDGHAHPRLEVGSAAHDNSYESFS